jgi:hypothetical protein
MGGRSVAIVCSRTQATEFFYRVNREIHIYSYIFIQPIIFRLFILLYLYIHLFIQPVIIGLSVLLSVRHQ